MSFMVIGAQAAALNPEDVVRAAAKWASSHGAEICLLDARKVFGHEHLESAVLHAIRARHSGTMSSRSLAMETLLYAAGARQVQDAIQLVGLRPDTSAMGVVIFGAASVDDFLRHMGWTRDDGVLEAKGKALKDLGISGGAAATVSRTQRADLVLEKVALLDVQK